MEKNSYEIANLIANNVGRKIVEGKIIDDIKVPFTMLDYYSLYNEDINYIYHLVRGNRIKGKYDYYENIFCEFYEKKAVVNRIIDDPIEILKQRNGFIINGERIIPNLGDIIEIFNAFDNMGVPKINRLIYTALERYVKELPLFPFIEEEKKLVK